VDEFKNPDLYTKDLMELLVAKNQKTKGRIMAIEVRDVCFLLFL